MSTFCLIRDLTFPLEKSGSFTENEEIIALVRHQRPGRQERDRLGGHHGKQLDGRRKKKKFTELRRASCARLTKEREGPRRERRKG